MTETVNKKYKYCNMQMFDCFVKCYHKKVTETFFTNILIFTVGNLEVIIYYVWQFILYIGPEIPVVVLNVSICE